MWTDSEADAFWESVREARKRQHRWEECFDSTCWICAERNAPKVRDWYTINRVFGIVATGLALFAIICFLVSQMISPYPHCPEDATLVGLGEYNGGVWTKYTCGPAVDDFVR